MPGELDELRTLTVRELSQATGIQKWRIHQMVAQSEAPPHFRVGRVIRFPISAVKKWLEEKTSTGTAG